MNHHEEVEPRHRPKLHYLVRKSGKPEERSDNRNVKEDESAPRCVVGYGAQHEKETPFAFVNGVEFVGEQR